MSGVVQDLRYALRQLQKSPGFMAVALFTLALGIGVSTAMFGVMNAVLLQPPPFPDPDRVVRILETRRGTVEGELWTPFVPYLSANESVWNEAPGGKYQLMVGCRSNNLRDYFIKPVKLDGRGVADSGFHISPEMSLDGVFSANGGTIEVTVTDNKGKPTAYATVVDVPSAEHRARHDLYYQDKTDERGHLSLRGLNPGKYTTLAFEEFQGLPTDIREPNFLTPYRGPGEEIQLVVTGLGSALTQAQASALAKPLSPPEQALITNEKNLIEAKKNDDHEYFKRVLADGSFALVGIDGKLHEHQEAVDELGDSDLVELTPYDMKVLPARDDAAIVTYDAIFRETPNQDKGPQPRYQHFSSLWVKQGDQWKLKFHQATAAHWGDW